MPQQEEFQNHKEKPVKLLPRDFTGHAGKHPIRQAFSLSYLGSDHQGRIEGLGMKWNYEKSFQPGPGLIHGYMNPAPAPTTNTAVPMRPILPHHQDRTTESEGKH